MAKANAIIPISTAKASRALLISLTIVWIEVSKVFLLSLLLYSPGYVDKLKPIA